MWCVSQFGNTSFFTKHKKNCLRRSVILSNVEGHQSKTLLSIITSQVLFTFLRVLMWDKFVIQEILLNSWIELLGQFFQLICSFTLSTLFRMGLFWTAHGLSRGKGGGVKKVPFSKICHTYPKLMKLGTVIPHLRMIQKYINHVKHPSSSADINIFSRKISNFCFIKKYRYRLHFKT